VHQCYNKGTNNQIVLYRYCDMEIVCKCVKHTQQAMHCQWYETLL